MPPTDTDEPSVDPARRAQLADLLTELRLGIDLGEIRSRAAFRTRLERNGAFAGDDPWVRRSCASAGLAWWLLAAPD